MQVRRRVVDGAPKLGNACGEAAGMNPFDPNPDYDGSDEIEYFFRYLTWGLRGVVDGQGYPPPSYPPV
jgi:hypothetical protein